MSLINDALKKVQRQHGHEPHPPLPAATGDAAPPPSQPSYPQRRGNPPPGQMVVLIGAGAAVLVVLSVIITVLLVNRKPAPVTPTVTSAPPKPAPDLSGPSPVIVAPVISLPTNLGEKPATTVTPDTVAASVIAAPPAAPVPEPTTATAQIPALTVAPLPDERIIAFVDAIRVTGIKSSGNESKVMMNDKIYRVNDTVERLLGVKLIKVESEMLTFADEHGVTYTKTF